MKTDFLTSWLRQQSAHWITGTGDVVEPTVPLEFAAIGLQRFAQASQFRRACMLMISWSIPSEETPLGTAGPSFLIGRPGPDFEISRIRDECV